MRIPRVGAAALTSAPTPYRASPPMKQRFRPQRSVSLLHGIMRMAMIRRKSVIAVCTPLTLVFRSSLMSLIITFMFEPAKLQMNCASASGRRSLRADASGRAPEGGSAATAWVSAMTRSLRAVPADGSSVLDEVERCSVQAEPDLEPHLVMGDAAVLDVAADLGDFEPVEVPYRLRRLRDRAGDGVLDARGR